jgi:integrating conjugative element protein (TIGR03761 family)
MTGVNDNSGQKKQDTLQRKMDALLGWNRPATPTLGKPVVSSLADARDGKLGVLRGETTITIQTKQAQRLLMGREGGDGRQPVTGLMKFSGYLAQISVAAKQDDPWADWMLVRVEELLQEAEEGLRLMMVNIIRGLDVKPMINIKVSESVEPLTVSIGYSASHAYWMARVITDYDEVVRGVLTLRHHALLDPEGGIKFMDEASRYLRRVFESVSAYRVTGVTRADVAAGSALAHQAQETLSKLGPVPADILEGSRRAKYAPVIPRTVNAPDTKGAAPVIVGAEPEGAA